MTPCLSSGHGAELTAGWSSRQQHKHMGVGGKAKARQDDPQGQAASLLEGTSPVQEQEVSGVAAGQGGLPRETRCSSFPMLPSCESVSPPTLESLHGALTGVHSFLHEARFTPVTVCPELR